MASGTTENPERQIVIALVDGDAAIRRERQLMLRSENFDARSYATGAALLADPVARASGCIVIESGDAENGRAELLNEMRAEGWQGRAILLLDSPEGDQCLTSSAGNDIALPRLVADRPLLLAIRTALATA